MNVRGGRTLTARAAWLAALVGVVLTVLLVGITWRATSPAWFLAFPVLLLGILAAAAVVVLWILRHF